MLKSLGKLPSFSRDSAPRVICAGDFCVSETILGEDSLGFRGLRGVAGFRAACRALGA